MGNACYSVLGGYHCLFVEDAGERNLVLFFEFLGFLSRRVELGDSYDFDSLCFEFISVYGL